MRRIVFQPSDLLLAQDEPLAPMPEAQRLAVLIARAVEGSCGYGPPLTQELAAARQLLEMDLPQELAPPARGLALMLLEDRELDEEALSYMRTCENYLHDVLHGRETIYQLPARYDPQQGWLRCWADWSLRQAAYEAMVKNQDFDSYSQEDHERRRESDHSLPPYPEFCQLLSRSDSSFARWVAAGCPPDEQDDRLSL